MKHRRPYLSLIGFLLAISFSIAGCTWFNDASFEGVDGLVFNGEKYVTPERDSESGGFPAYTYEMLDDLVAYTSNDYEVYSMKGDENRNYLIADRMLYRKESFNPKHDTWIGISFGDDSYVEETQFIDKIKSIVKKEPIAISELERDKCFDCIGENRSVDLYAKFKDDPACVWLGTVLEGERKLLYRGGREFESILAIVLSDEEFEYIKEAKMKHTGFW